jgi:hypothetical protein
MHFWKDISLPGGTRMDHDLERRIRERAYEIWEDEGRPSGREALHWQQAATEFAEAQREQAIAPAPPPTKRTRSKSPAAEAALPADQRPAELSALASDPSRPSPPKKPRKPSTRKSKLPD